MFRKVNADMDTIMKSMEHALDDIRNKFPRLYLLSNDEVLNILAQSKDPRSLQSYFKKIFDNIQEVKFDKN